MAAENFAQLLEEFSPQQSLEGSVLKGVVTSVGKEFALIDVGLKSEGRVNLREFKNSGEEADLQVGDEVDVYLERMEDREGVAVLSRDKARREERWIQLSISHKKNEHVTGQIVGRVKGGFTVDLGGSIAFLPGSQVDVRPIKDATPLMGKEQPFLILKMDRRRGNIVVSRRAILEESRSESRNEIVENLAEGQVIKGIVKNITDYGAFIDLGGVDGLLHVTDITWKRIQHPSEVLSIGQQVEAQIIKFNPENQRISLGMRQLEDDPWQGIEERYPVSKKVTGRVTNIADYGAFVELEAGVEGLVHVSEMSWTKKNVPPAKIISTSQEVEVMILDVDESRRRISLGMKQCSDNPWQKFANQSKVGDVIEGEIKNITEFGLFVGLIEEIDGMVHLSDLSWSTSGEEALKTYEKGQMIKAKILDIDVEKERVGLGVKQLEADPFADKMKDISKGAIVTCTIESVNDAGISVLLPGDMPGFIKKSDLSRDKGEQRTDRFAAGEKVDAKVTAVDLTSRKIGLSIKALEIDEQKQVMAEYGSSDSGASLGDILGEAIKSQTDK